MPAGRAWIVSAAIAVSLVLVSCGGDGTGLPGAVVDGGVSVAPGGMIGAQTTGGHFADGFTPVILPGTFPGGIRLARSH